MNVIKGRNAQQILPEMMTQLASSADVVSRDSRNGPVLMFDVPCTIQYNRPTERVVFHPERDANPFFHLFESLWMLAGRDDVAYPARFSANIAQFSDDGLTFHGAYGHRWRGHFGRDQLPIIIAALKANTDDRRCVLQMWDARCDLGREGKDVPCNIEAVFNRDRWGHLNMTVYNRSNDALWGALGANCVHFSMLQELVAAGIGCEVGRYWQVSANMHAYTELSPVYKNCAPLASQAFPSKQHAHGDPYAAGLVRPYPLVCRSAEGWLTEAVMFCDVGGKAMGYREPFFRKLAIPMEAAYAAFKELGDPNRYANAIALMDNVVDCDWKLAGIEWLSRRWVVAARKAAEAATKAQAAGAE